MHLSYHELCEQLYHSWKEDGLKVTEELRPVFQLDYMPEPYLTFGSADKPLIFLTTNPGAGMPHQHRDAVASSTSPVEAGEDYRAAAIAMAEWYCSHLTGPARRRIASMQNLASSAGFTGVEQIESLPYHSPDLPKKADLLSRITGDTTLSAYVKSLRNYLKDKTVLTLSAAGGAQIGVETIRRSPWLSWQADLMALDLSNAAAEPILLRDEKATCVLVHEKRDTVTKGIILMMGGNHLPGADGLHKIASVLRRG